MIGDDIEISVLAVVGDKVRLGIQAPREIPVFRKEVYNELQLVPASPSTDTDAESTGKVDAEPPDNVD
jgi:carbon storage regulator